MTGIWKKTLAAMIAFTTVACMASATVGAGWIQDSSGSSYH